jgi:hypothetical protein
MTNIQEYMNQFSGHIILRKIVTSEHPYARRSPSLYGETPCQIEDLLDVPLNMTPGLSIRYPRGCHIERMAENEKSNNPDLYVQLEHENPDINTNFVMMRIQRDLEKGTYRLSIVQNEDGAEDFVIKEYEIYSPNSDEVFFDEPTVFEENDASISIMFYNFSARFYNIWYAFRRRFLE